MLTGRSELTQTSIREGHFLPRVPHVDYVRLVTDLADQHPTPRYRLTTFGAPTLLGPEDSTFLGKHGHHRRRLALLAVLAAAGEKGRSRDQLLLLFWPDATQARARHSLDQLIYALRNSISEDVFEGTNPLRLNPEIVGSDVGAFNAALRRGDLEAAVASYHGPFLDGFYLGDAPEFEQWAEAERARLATAYAGALQQMAEAADAAGNHAIAVARWRTLTETDLLSSRNAAGLIRALLRAGDHAEALQYAKRHEALVKQELGMTASPAVTSLVAEVLAASREPQPPVAPEVHASRAAVVPPDNEPKASVSAPVTTVEPQLQRVTPTRRSAAMYVFGGLVALGVAAAALWLRPTRAESTTAPALAAPSVAVLPFANLGGDQRDAALVDGLTEELIAVLARVGHLRVMGGTSAFAFRNSDLDVRRIADSLGVMHVLAGSVQKVDTRLRVQVRLVDARDGSTRWSETYDRELRDVFAVQDEIARAVAIELGLRLGVGGGAPRRQPTRSVAAYEHYLRGNDRSLLRSDSSARVALEHFRRAVAMDSTYAAAWAGIARMHGRLGGAMPSKDRDLYYALALQYARKAVSLDDSLPEAHATLGVMSLMSFDFQDAERHLTRALELDPAAPFIHEWMVTLYLWKEQPAEALVHAHRALELDPLSPYAHAEVGRALLGNDRCREAFGYLDKVKGLQPPLPRASVIAAQCYAREKMWTQAIATTRPQAERGVPAAAGMLGYMLARSGQREDAMRIERELRDQWQRDAAGAFSIALVHVGLTNFDEAFIWLDRAISDRSLIGAPGNPAHVAIMGPLFEDLRRQPRFTEVRERLGLQKR